MNILVTLDSNYVEQLITMLNSLTDSNGGCFDVYVAHSSLTMCDFLNIAAHTNSRRITLHPIKVSAELFDGAHFTSRITKETYYRLLLFEYLPESVERILYLDPDIIVLNSVSLLYNIDFGDMIFAGAGHTDSIIRSFNLFRLDMGAYCEYINAGVLMINVKNMRKSITSDEIFSYVHAKGKLLFQADQDVINALFWDKTIYINPCFYNLDERIFRKYHLTLDWVERNCVFVHYDGRNKPWKDGYSGYLNVFYDRYDLKQTVPKVGVKPYEV